MILEDKILDFIEAKSKIKEGESAEGRTKASRGSKKQWKPRQTTRSPRSRRSGDGRRRRARNTSGAPETASSRPNQALERDEDVLIPNVVETTHRGERGWSIFTGSSRTASCFSTTRSTTCWRTSIIAQFLFLESEDPDKEIMVYINSPGGVVTSGLAIHDTMQYVRCDVSTTCLGMAASMAAVLLAAGTRVVATRCRTRAS